MNNRTFLTRALSSVKNWDILTLTEKMGNLSRKSDINLPSSSSSISNSSRIDSSLLSHTKEILDRFIMKTQLSDLSRSVVDKSKSSIFDIKSSICDISTKSTDLFLTLAFRFLPGQDSFITKNLSLPNSADRIIDLKNQLGLSLSKDSLTNMAKIKYNTIAEKASTMYSRILVEAITYNNGYYGRFLVLVELGIGCTIWYGFLPGSGISIPVDGLLFNPIDSYDGFINNPEIHVQPGFDKITLAESSENILPKLAEAYTHEKPFNDVKIPNASGSVLMSVSMGLAIVILLSLGIAPNVELNAVTI